MQYNKWIIPTTVLLSLSLLFGGCKSYKPKPGSPADPFPVKKQYDQLAGRALSPEEMQDFYGPEIAKDFMPKIDNRVVYE